MRKVILVHGALKRKSTKEYMNNLSIFLTQNGFEPLSFYWSGYPLASFVKKACAEFIDFFQTTADSTTQIICKSVGADVVNCALSVVTPRRIVKVAPAYVVSASGAQSQDAFTITLEKDEFLKVWGTLRIVHSLASRDGIDRQYVIKHEKGVTHHTINFNIPVEIIGIGRMNLYEFYRTLLER